MWSHMTLEVDIEGCIPSFNQYWSACLSCIVLDGHCLLESFFILIYFLFVLLVRFTFKKNSFWKIWDLRRSLWWMASCVSSYTPGLLSHPYLQLVEGKERGGAQVESFHRSSTITDPHTPLSRSQQLSYN